MMKSIHTIKFAIIFIIIFFIRCSAVYAQSGYALQFDSKNDYVVVGNVDLGLSAADAVTVNTWLMWDVNPAPPGTNIYTTLVANNSALVDDDAQFWLQHDNFNTYFQFQVSVVNNGQVNTRIVTSTTSPVINEWYMLTGTYNGTYLIIYVNGIMEDSLYAPGVITAFENDMILTIGGSAKNSNKYRRFHGIMDEVSVWNIALSPTQVSYLYGCVLTGDDAGLQGYWQMDEPSGIVVGDSSGNGNHGTNIGTATIVGASAPIGDCILPVEALYFQAVELGGSIMLEWATASETNNDYFTLRRSKDSENWEYVATINGAGNSNTITNYSYTDNYKFSSSLYYSLVQTDYDGKSAEVGTLSLSGGAGSVNDVIIYPNPAKDFLKLEHGNSIAENTIINIQIFDLLGILVSEQSIFSSENYTVTIDLSELSSGVYFLKATSNHSIIYSEKFLVQ